MTIITMPHPPSHVQWKEDMRRKKRGSKYQEQFDTVNSLSANIPVFFFCGTKRETASLRTSLFNNLSGSLKKAGFKLNTRISSDERYLKVWIEFVD